MLSVSKVPRAKNHSFENRSLKKVGYRVENDCVKLGKHRNEDLNLHVEKVMLVRMDLPMSQINMDNSAHIIYPNSKIHMRTVIAIMIFDNFFAMLRMQSLLLDLCLSGHVIYISTEMLANTDDQYYAPWHWIKYDIIFYYVCMWSRTYEHIICKYIHDTNVTIRHVLPPCNTDLNHVLPNPEIVHIVFLWINSFWHFKLTSTILLWDYRFRSCWWSSLIHLSMTPLL